MEISVGKHERNSRETWKQAEGLAGKPERNREGPENKERARKRALQKSRVASEAS